jgi:S1-C subfamily serine protease
MQWIQSHIERNAQFLDSPDGPSSNTPRAVGRPATDADLLDAYSQAVIHVVETVSPAVISVFGRDAEGRGGAGSGFIVTPDGYAITNSHVVEERPNLMAETADGDKLRAELVGDDPATDLAVVRLAPGCERVAVHSAGRQQCTPRGSTSDCDGQPAWVAIYGFDRRGECLGPQYAGARRAANREYRSACGAD